ncbi:uncharacterized protein [Drosophila takahashii]|uniref:uncharacterized protein n=1 Tax=Drosophila takahashii TaxID=29030 RepID=UPI001CF8BB99|nr:uncharacterized protein LOC108064219 isoform X2 [Drosophila takahashii]
MSERNEKGANSSVANTVLKKVESLLDISGSSLDANSLSCTLGKTQSVPQNGDHSVKSIADMALPKLRSELGYDVVHKEVQKIKESLDAYSQQMQSVDQDVAEIFLDLHNIYKRLEKLDGSGRKLSSAKKAKLLKHVKESEDLLSRSRHFLTNDPKEMSAMLVGPPKEPQSSSKGD